MIAVAEDGSPNRTPRLLGWVRQTATAAPVQVPFSFWYRSASGGLGSGTRRNLYTRGSRVNAGNALRLGGIDVCLAEAPWLFRMEHLLSADEEKPIGLECVEVEAAI